MRKIAERLDVSAATVRYWLGKFGLATRYAVRSASRRTARGASRIELDCAQHGATIFIREGDRYRCGRCRSEAVTRWRRRVKEILVEEAGGRCALCGYDRCLRALEFHHVDPSSKSFAIAPGGVTRALDAARAEAAKCVLLCANCHAEVEAGFSELPPPPQLPIT